MEPFVAACYVARPRINAFLSIGRLWHILRHMKTASIRDLRHDFNRVLAWVSNGEEVAITKHRRTVARLLPAHSRTKAAARMPDIVGRLQKVFGRKIIPDKAMRVVLDESQGAY